jgi:hypothetical protein
MIVWRRTKNLTLPINYRPIIYQLKRPIGWSYTKRGNKQTPYAKQHKSRRKQSPPPHFIKRKSPRLKNDSNGII